MSPIPLSEYPRPPHDNGRGIHWTANVYPLEGEKLEFWINELKALQIKWVKVLDDGGGSSLPLCRKLIENDIMPVVRLFREYPNPGHIGGREANAIAKLIDVGVRYFETNNEPDLPAEWKNGFMPDDWLDIVVENFIHDADVIQQAGGFPAYPAMSPWHEPGLGIDKVVARGRKDIFEKGAWLALHNYTTNHPPDYPYDSVNQTGEPLTKEEYERLAAWQYSHLTWEEVQALDVDISYEDYERFNRWAWDGRTREMVNAVRQAHKNPGATIFDDSNCFRSYELAGHNIYQALGFYIPVISTEGGPVVGGGDDDRYAKLNPFTHAQWQMEIVRFLQDEAPPWYFTLCTWMIASVPMGDMSPTWDQMSWYTHAWDLQFGLDGELPIVQKMKDIPAQIRHELRPDNQMAAVTGTVFDSNHEPVTGIMLALQTQDGETVANAVSDEDGKYVLSAKPGVYDIFIKWYGPAIQNITLESFDLDNINIENIDPPGQFEVWGYVQEGEQNLPGLEIAIYRHGILMDQTISDENGKFSFQPGLVGEYLLKAFDASATVEVSQTEPVVQQDLILPIPDQMRYTLASKQLIPPTETDRRDIFYGSVRDRYGRGMNDIELEMRWTGAAPDTKFPRVKTSPGVDKWDGYYEFWHSKGAFTIQVVQGDHPSDVAQLEVMQDEDEHAVYQVDFQLQPVESATAQSVITGSIPGGRFEQKVILWKDGQAVAEAALNNSRTFSFSQLQAGVYDLELAGIGIFETGIVLDGNNQLEIEFPLLGAIEGSVDNHDNQTNIKLISETYGFIRHSEVSKDRRYRFTHLPAGTYRVELGDEIISGLQSDGVSVLTAPTLKPKSSVMVKSSITGRVHDTANRPIPDIEVSLLRAGKVINTTQTDEHGVFQFDHLKSGIYDVKINSLVGASGLVLDGENQVETDLLYSPVASATPKLIDRYYLLRTSDERVTPSLLRMLSPWLQNQPEGMIGFNLAEARQANVVILLGDDFPPPVISLLENSNCEIVDMSGDLLELAQKLNSFSPAPGDSHD